MARHGNDWRMYDWMLECQSSSNESKRQQATAPLERYRSRAARWVVGDKAGLVEQTAATRAQQLRDRMIEGGRFPPPQTKRGTKREPNCANSDMLCPLPL